MKSKENDKLIKNPSPDYYKFLELEAKESIQSFRTLATVLVQIATVLATANVVIVGYALSNTSASLFILGAGVTTLLLVAYRGGIKASVPLLCRFVELEKLFKSHMDLRFDTGVTSLISSIFGRRFIEELSLVSEISDFDKKRNAMRKLERRMFFRYTTNKGTLILIGAIVLQFALTAILLFVFNWDFI